MKKNERYSPWTDLYEAMRDWVPQNDAERIVADKLGEGAGFAECMECSGLTWEEFQDLFDRLRDWENNNCDKPENWYRNPARQAGELKSWFMGMSDRDVQCVLKVIPKETIPVAMNSWDRELCELILKNLPRLVREEIGKAVEDRKAEFTDKQMAEANGVFEKAIQRLEDAGDIHIYLT